MTKKEIREKKAQKDLPDDSVSEITDLGNEEILAKYYKNKLTKIE